MSGLEKDIEMPVVKWAQKNEFLTPKVKFAEAGWPDRLFISPRGHTIFIEFKRPPEKPDKLQEYRLAQLRQRGIPALWTDSVLEGINILKAAMEPSSLSEESDNITPFSGSSGAVSGSGSGEDQHRPSELEITLQKSIDKARADRSSDSSNVFSLAGRDSKMERIRRNELLDPPRQLEGDESYQLSTDPSDQS